MQGNFTTVFLKKNTFFFKIFLVRSAVQPTTENSDSIKHNNRKNLQVRQNLLHFFSTNY